jgi:hypothetical protein
MTTEVTDLIAALRDGALSLDEVAQRFRSRSWPRRTKPLPTTYMELAAAAQEDPDPTVPGSFDEVDAAYYLGNITDQQYEVLAQAMAESMRAEDRRKAEEAADRTDS